MYTNQPIDYIQIIPSYRCNRACSYCYNQYFHQDVEEQPDKLIPSLDSFVKRQKIPFVAEVIGGEPLHAGTINTTKSVLEILTHSTFCKKRVLSTACGELRTLKKIIKLIDFVYLSIDISHSVINTKKMDFKRISRVSSFFANEQVELTLAVVLYGDETEKDLENFVLFAKDINIENICFGYIGFNHLTSSEIFNYSKLFYLLFILKNILSKDIFLGGDVLETLELAVQGIRRQKLCSCGESSLVFQPEGIISPSICIKYIPNSSTSCADFIKMKIERRSALENSRCNNCELWPTCLGGCIGASILLYKNHLYREKVFCSILCQCWDLIKKDLEIVEMKKLSYRNIS